MKILEKIDVFGKSFVFRMQNEEKVKTRLGGILTLFFVTMTIAFTITFGKNFINHRDPQIIYETVFPDEYKKINQFQTNLVAWRVEDAYSSPIEFSEMFYMNFQFYSYERENLSYVLKEQIIMPNKKCNLTEYNNTNLKLGYDLESFYCFYFPEGQFFGGGWDGSFLNYFSIDFCFCKEGNAYNRTNPDCFDPIQTKNNLYNNNGLFFSLIYPEYYLSPNNIDSPLNINYKNYFYSFNLNLQKIDRYYFQQVLLNDDLGWMIDDFREKNVFALNYATTDMLYFTDADLIDETRNSCFYTIIFYMSKNYQSIRRSFMKIQDVAAKVGGIIKILMFISQALLDYYVRFIGKVKIIRNLNEMKEK